MVSNSIALFTIPSNRDSVVSFCYLSLNSTKLSTEMNFKTNKIRILIIFSYLYINSIYHSNTCNIFIIDMIVKYIICMITMILFDNSVCIM